MTPRDCHDLIVRPTLAWMGGRYDTHAAAVLLVAIALQESDLRHRAQVGGPARSLWQFELGGLTGVFNHAASREMALQITGRLLYVTLDPRDVYLAIRDNDILACVMARLLLWTDPKPLPNVMDEQATWNYYLWLWRPSRPRRDDWATNLADARYAAVALA